MPPRYISLAFAVVFTACSTTESPTVAFGDQPEFVTWVDAGEPNLHVTPNGTVLLSWLAQTDSGTALMVAARTDGAWGQPRAVYRSSDMFANWADFPSVAVTTDGTWVVHWLEKVESAPYAYHARLSRSQDRGQTWSEPVTIHSDRSATEHGFVSMVPGSAGDVDMVWLDGRQTGTEPRGAMQVRFASLEAGGRMHNESAVDDRVCDCCQTALARSRSGLVAAYRDRSETEIRDIAVRVLRDDGWSTPVHVGNDEWYITGCPVNGPSLTTTGDTVAIAWFTGANQAEKVQVAFSVDGGRSFGEPIRIDAGAPLGRVDIEFINDSTAFVIWLERVGEDAEIRGLTVNAHRRTGREMTVLTTSQARQSGFPRIARSGNELLIAHRALSDSGSTVRVLRAAIEE